MTILAFDCETTGFHNERLPLDHPSQPYIVQLAAQLCEDDGKPVAGFSLIIDNGVEIPARAAAVHGITTEKAKEFGVPLVTALMLFSHLCNRADQAIAHNAKFDKAVMDTAYARQFDSEKIFDLPLFCTMEAATPIVNLPPTDRMIAAGFDKPKAPKLEECIKHFFNEELEGAHDAMIDLAACLRVYLHLKSLEQAIQKEAG